jgi:hypothetical protein
MPSLRNFTRAVELSTLVWYQVKMYRVSVRCVMVLRQKDKFAYVFMSLEAIED